jgi:pullulanase/glycogen debranching enzyme
MPSWATVEGAPLGYLCACEDVFDWRGDERSHHESDLIIYELHVKGFTNHPNSDVSPDTRGTYAGLIEKFPYLQELGVTAVEFMPVFQYDPQDTTASHCMTWWPTTKNATGQTAITTPTVCMKTTAGTVVGKAMTTSHPRS